MTHATVLDLSDVTVRYEQAARPAIAGLSLSMAHGERVALLGLNGSGKTTLMLAVAGVIPHQGEIVIGGHAVNRRNQEQVRHQLGVVLSIPEDQLLFPTVLEDVAFGLLRRGAAKREALEVAQAALASVGIVGLASCSVHSLSHGQKQRVALAGALVSSPGLLLLDEPSAGLDPPGRRQLAKSLGELDSAMLIATHDIEWAARICTRFVVLRDGAVCYDGPTQREAVAVWDPTE